MRTSKAKTNDNKVQEEEHVSELELVHGGGWARILWRIEVEEDLDLAGLRETASSSPRFYWCRRRAWGSSGAAGIEEDFRRPERKTKKRASSTDGGEVNRFSWVAFPVNRANPHKSSGSIVAFR